ncbi:uncharacterized protein Bfra_002713 [Botrytis fragariae]|uniref:Uncharacterized protein n=1 Tax=Botrytis fragariae TaxID=1964551 RepID=A0A8H6AYZ8_9HELO|nr:uncharacterized protein Bfra_002713 [Botrytis fragariae]KAF5876309.1 hypothetical protein Bfra_002713 [Botrytis fragariae]
MNRSRIRPEQSHTTSIEIRLLLNAYYLFHSLLTLNLAANTKRRMNTQEPTKNPNAKLQRPSCVQKYAPNSTNAAAVISTPVPATINTYTTAHSKIVLSFAPHSVASQLR